MLRLHIVLYGEGKSFNNMILVVIWCIVDQCLAIYRKQYFKRKFMSSFCMSCPIKYLNLN